MPPVALPFPVSALPGRRPGEGQGDLVNVFARKVGNIIRWQRTPGTLRFTQGNGWRQYIQTPPTLPALPLPQLGAPRGQLTVEPYLLSVFGDKVVRTTTAGVEQTCTGLSLPGTAPVTMARNMRDGAPDVVVVADGTPYVIDVATATVVAYPDPDLTLATSVDYFSGYFVFSRTNGYLVASQLQSTAVDPASFAKAEGVADGLRRVYASAPILLALGTESIEVYQDVGSSPWPFQRVTIIPVGLIGTWAIAGGATVWDRPVCFVAHDNTVRQLRGSDPVIVSTEDVVADIEIEARAGRAEQLFAQAYTHGDNAIWSLSSPTWTWEYNLSTSGWHRRRSYHPGDEIPFQGARWRACWAARLAKKWIAQDTIDSGLVEITSEALQEPEIVRARPNPLPGDPAWVTLQAPLVARCESGPAKEAPANVRMAAIYLDFTVGFEVSGTPEPVVTLSWSHDGGANWSSPLVRHIGGDGEYRTLVTLRSTGRSSHMGMRVAWECVDPVPIAFHGAVAPRTTASRPRQVGVVVTGGGLGSGG